jgi:hypothetical protein
MEETKMVRATSEKERGAFEAAIAGADAVEIKFTIREDEKAEAAMSLDLDPDEAARRDIYFFDTPDLDLYRAGLVARARGIAGDTDDSTVKIRPADPKAIGKQWREMEGFKLEADVVGDKVVISASLKAPQNPGEIEDVVAGKRAISKLFSPDQERFLQEFSANPIDFDALAALGPIPTLRLEVERPGLAYELTAERWEMPDGDKLLELSIKCPPEEAAVARKAFEGFLAGHGLDVHGVQKTKTKTALECFAKRLKAP